MLTVMQTLPGNHERLYPQSGDRYNMGRDSGGECGVVYERRLQMPVQGEDRPWYSFDFGPVHFLAFSTEHRFEEGSEQYQSRSLTESLIQWSVDF